MVEDCSSKKRPREVPSKVMKSSKESVKRAERKNRGEERLQPQFLIIIGSEYIKGIAEQWMIQYLYKIGRWKFSE